MKNLFRPSIIIPVLILIAISSIYWVWLLLPMKQLNIVVLNKNVPASLIDKNNNLAGDYRKHMGLFWVLNNQKYKNPETSTLYDYKKDYYGPLLDVNSNIIGVRNLEKTTITPDIIYLADGYGDITNTTIEKGITENDIGIISSAYTQGSKIIGEFNISSLPTKIEVKNEIENLFGIEFSGWIGRFILDMQDLKDVPSWALSLYETQYGKVWDLSGSGIILVSENSELVILQKGIDYEGTTMTVSMIPQFKEQFGDLSVNYYNWFELIKTSYGTDTVAQYKLPLSEKGKEKFSKIATEFVFPAITKKVVKDKYTYYFAGDFNDYTIAERSAKYFIAEKFNQLFSYERTGDVTNFFWKFYVPIMRTILDEAYKNKPSQAIETKADSAKFHLENSTFMVKEANSFKPFDVRGFNISATMPGDQALKYTRDISIYREMITTLSDMGANTIRAYDLLPPEFYRAIYENNKNNPDSQVYLFQSITIPSTISKTEIMSIPAQAEIQKNIEYTVDAIHGDASIPQIGARLSGEYYNDVSSYLISYIVDIGATTELINLINKADPSYTYQGTYLGAYTSPAEALMARICDNVLIYESNKFTYSSPIGALGNVITIENAPWKDDAAGVVFDISRINAKESLNGQFFAAYNILPSDKILIDHTTDYLSYKDEKGDFPYGGYLQAVKNLNTKYPVFINQFGSSTNTNAFEKENHLNGHTEYEQGEALVRMMKAITKEKFLGSLVSDLNDNWNSMSPEFEPYIIPKKNKPLWQNALDPAQNTGIIAIEPVSSDDPGMVLQDFGRMTQMITSSSESYLYLTILLRENIDYNKEILMIGIDTYQRNSGEYLFDPKYFATSLSGLEYLIKFDSSRSGSIYVIPSYNRNTSHYSSVESNTGQYDFICPLKYGTFETSNSNFYAAGTNLHIRIPWSVLNFTDPSKRMVIEDKRSIEEIKLDPFGIRTQTTNGILFSVVISDIATKDTLYQFPSNKQSTGFKTFTWHNWDKVKYRLRLKESCDIIKRFYKSQSGG